VSTQEREPLRRGPREPSAQRPADPREVRPPPGHGDDRDAGGTVDRIQIDRVEPPDDRPVEQDRPDAVHRPERPQERDDAPGGVSPVHADAADPGRLKVLRGRDDHRRERGVAVAPGEGAVVHRRDAGVVLAERPTQR